MRVVDIAVAWPAETFLVRRLEALAARGVEVIISTPSEPGPRHLGIPGTQLHAWGNANPRGAWRAARDVSVLLRAGHLGSLQRAAKPNPGLRGRLRQLSQARAIFCFGGVLHFEWPMAAISVLPMLEATDAPLVVSCRGTQLNINPYLSRCPDLAQGLRRLFQRAQAVHCVSERIAQQAQQFGLEERKMVLIRPALNPDNFTCGNTERWAEPTLRLIAIGALRWRKDYETLLLALHQLVARGVNAQLSIVGSGPGWEHARFTVHDLQLESRVELLGQLPPAEVAALLGRSHVLVHASVSEGISNAVLEGMASGLAVVSTDCGGTREVIRDDSEGLVVPTRAPQALAQALAVLAADRPRCQALGEAGRQRIRNHFNLEQQTDAFYQLYSRLS